MSSNEFEIKLLHTNPGELIILYQGMIEFIVQNQLINPGFINRQNREDVIQTVNEHLLKKIPYIKKHYNGLSLLKTYFSVIIRNKCLEYNRSRLKQKTIYLSHQSDFSAPGKKSIIYQKKYQKTGLQEGHRYTSRQETTKRIVLDYEFRRFDAILDTYSKQKAKIELCIKYFFQIPCLISEIKAYWPQATNKYLLLFSRKMNGKMTKTERYKNLTELINNSENKTNSNDAIRKWLADRMKELIFLLNGAPQQNYFDEETFQYFVEEYYFTKDNK